VVDFAKLRVIRHIPTPPRPAELAVRPSSHELWVLNEDGSLGAMTDHVPLQGKLGPHRVEQPFALPENGH